MLYNKQGILVFKAYYMQAIKLSFYLKLNLQGGNTKLLLLVLNERSKANIKF